VFVGTLVTPGGRASAEKVSDPVEVTNLPLPVKILPRPFVGREELTLPDGSGGASGDGSFVAPAGAVIETINVQIVLPSGQQPVFAMQVPSDNGTTVGIIRVPLQFQATLSGLTDVYVGTVTNVRAPMGTVTARPVNFEWGRNNTSGIAVAHVTVTGLPG
jgi:hypothetical protein